MKIKNFVYNSYNGNIIFETRLRVSFAYYNQHQRSQNFMLCSYSDNEVSLKGNKTINKQHMHKTLLKSRSDDY